MSTDNEFSSEERPEDRPDDVAQGIRGGPEGNGDLDQDALEAGRDKLEQAGGGH